MKATKNTIGLVSTLALTLLVGGTGCGDATQEEDVEAPAFAAVGQEDVPDTEYAPGPYGYDKGKIIPNFEFIGYPNFMAGGDLTWVSLADFYNPTGDEVFPEGSPYGAGQPKPTALLMLMSAAWCGPCRDEANQLKTKYPQEIQPGGGHILGLLLENNTPGEPATYHTATAWADAYDVSYTLAIDPASQVMSLYEPAFPGNMIIRTSDMKIIEIIAGSPQPGSPTYDAFWGTFEKVKNGTYDG